jgi:hypothetical protein
MQIVKIAIAVALGVLFAAGLISLYVHTREPSTEALLEQYQELKAACLDGAGQTGALACRRAIEFTCKWESRIVAGPPKWKSPADCIANAEKRTTP